MQIKNTGDQITITLESGHTVTYDGTKFDRLTGNDKARFVGQIIASAIDSVKSVIPAGMVEAMTAGVPVNSPWNGKLPPITNPDMVVETEYVPSGNANEDEIREE